MSKSDWNCLATYVNTSLGRTEENRRYSLVTHRLWLSETNRMEWSANAHCLESPASRISIVR